MSLSRSSILIFRYPELASSIRNTVAFPRLSIHSSERRIGYKSQVVTTFNLPQWTQTRSEWSILRANPIGAAHSVVVGSMAFSGSIRFIYAAGNCLAVDSAGYGAERTGLTSCLTRSMRCLETVIRSKRQSHLLWNYVMISKKAWRCS